MRTLVELLGRPLRDPDVLEVLESLDLTVTYDFDRLNENTPDIYWAEARSEGFILRFDEDQMMETVFAYLEPSDGFEMVDPSMIGVAVPETFDAAVDHATSRGVTFQVSPAPPGSPLHRRWAKLHFGTFHAHYEFADDGGCRLVTLMRSKDD